MKRNLNEIGRIAEFDVSFPFTIGKNIEYIRNEK
jgi:hypothetical protein